MSYNYHWHLVMATPKEIDNATLGTAGTNIDEVCTQVETSSYQAVYQGLTEKAKEQGLTLAVSAITPKATYTSRQVPRNSPYPPPFLTMYKVSVTVDVDFISDKPLMGSPIAAALLLVIQWIIQAIVVIIIAYFVIQAIKDWLVSMVTTTSTVTEYNSQGQPVKTETTTQPTLGGWIAPVLALIAVLGGGGLVVLYFSKKPRSKKRRT
jgi:hypothetical protein